MTDLIVVLIILMLLCLLGTRVLRNTRMWKVLFISALLGTIVGMGVTLFLKESALAKVEKEEVIVKTENKQVLSIQSIATIVESNTLVKQAVGQTKTCLTQFSENSVQQFPHLSCRSFRQRDRPFYDTS